MFQTLHTHCISLSIAGIRLFVECGLQPSPGLDLFQQLRLCPAVLQRGPEMPGALPAAGLLPADKAGVLKVAEQVHHPDVVDILVHNQPTFQEEAAPNRQGAASSSYLLKSWISKKQSFCTCIRHYSPRRQGGSRRTVLAHITGISPLRGSLRAAPIAYSRYHPGLWLDRSIIIRLLTRVGLVQNQPQCETTRHRLLCGRMGTALYLPWPSLMRFPAQVVLAHPPASLRPSSRRASRQRTYPAAGYEVFNAS